MNTTEVLYLFYEQDGDEPAEGNMIDGVIWYGDVNITYQSCGTGMCLNWKQAVRKELIQHTSTICFAFALLYFQKNRLFLHNYHSLCVTDTDSGHPT